MTDNNELWLRAHDALGHLKYDLERLGILRTPDTAARYLGPAPMIYVSKTGEYGAVWEDLREAARAMESEQFRAALGLPPVKPREVPDGQEAD